MTNLPTSYDPWVVAASLFIASFAGYVAIDVAHRVRTTEGGISLAWWAGGSAVLGTGIWSMHFVGMLAFSLPIALGYTKVFTVLSWLAAIGVSAVALRAAAHPDLNRQRLIVASLAMGAGICTMHYIGMAALDMSPAVVWNVPLVIASGLIAVVASAAAVLIFFWLRRLDGLRAALCQLGSALLIGMAIGGMHYTGMAAAGFPEGTVCLSADSLSGSSLGTLVAMASLGVLSLTLLISRLDRRMRGANTRLAGSLQEANAQLQSANEELQRRAFLDPLTGLPNRLLFEDRLMHAVRRSERAEERIAERRQEKLAVLFIDLDGFKPVNDSFGHAAGDIVLKVAAARLRDIARDSDTVARVGGDEFVMLMEDIGGVADCLTLARRIVEALATPYDVVGHAVEISGSVGISVYPDHGHRHKLVAHADAAMYEAKRMGGNSFALFEPRMDAGAVDQLSLQADLRHAVELGQLQLHYQPKVDARRGKIHGVEALLRWNHPQRGLVGPDVFIPIAERFGMIGALGNWVISEACRQMEAWADQGVRMRVAINLSVHQLREEDLVERIERALELHHVEASQLLCEITESVAMEDIKATQRAFTGLARIGVFLSIDDFGTGYSSLSYLRQLPAQQLKIDRAFINDLETSADARAIVDAVVRLAHALGLRVVAEGVETAGQRDILLGLQCDELQGFFFARPMAADTLLEWTAGHKPMGSADFSPSIVDASI